jgi:hypothetical protein
MTYPTPEQPPPVVDLPRSPIKAGWAVIGGGAAAVVGSFLPWITITAAFVGTISRSGTDGNFTRGELSDGWIVVALGLAVVGLGILLVRGYRLAWTASLVSLALFGLAVFELLNVMDRLSDPAFESEMVANASIGPGLWLVLAAGIAAAIGALLVWNTPKTQR